MDTPGAHHQPGVDKANDALTAAMATARREMVRSHGQRQRVAILRVRPNLTKDGRWRGAAHRSRRQPGDDAKSEYP